MIDTEHHPWGWTPARRAEQAASIHRWKPWLASTGPVTPTGKARTSKNAAKPNSIRRQLANLKAELKNAARLAKGADARPRR
jgi:hypothetical protein